MAFNTQKFVRVSAGQFDNSQVAANFNYNGNAAQNGIKDTVK